MNTTVYATTDFVTSCINSAYDTYLLATSAKTRKQVTVKVTEVQTAIASLKPYYHTATVTVTEIIEQLVELGSEAWFYIRSVIALYYFVTEIEPAPVRATLPTLPKINPAANLPEAIEVAKVVVKEVRRLAGDWVTAQMGWSDRK